MNIIEQKYELIEVLKAVKNVMDNRMPSRHRECVLLRWEGRTFKEVGLAMGIGESRACQLYGQAEMRMRIYVAELEIFKGCKHVLDSISDIVAALNNFEEIAA